jgi:hypothetical protein
MTIPELLSLVPLIGFVASVVALVRLLRGLPGHIAQRLLLAMGVFLAHGAIGTVVLIYTRPFLSNTPAGAFGAVAALFGWIGLGAHLLIYLIPSQNPKPQWMLRPGIFDAACLLVIAGGIAVCTGLI